MRPLYLLVFVVACKGDPESKPVQPAVVKAAPAIEEPLPADFPLPASAKLVRSHKKLTMVVWEYEAAAGKLDDALRTAGYTVTHSDAERIVATKHGRMMVVTSGGGHLAVRSFPEAGPTTLNAPTSYPSTFPFLAGGTASHAPDGAKLTVAYQSDAPDIETAMVVAAEAAGWTCVGAGRVTCTKDKSNVTFTTEAAPGGSLLLVSAF